MKKTAIVLNRIKKIIDLDLFFSVSISDSKEIAFLGYYTKGKINLIEKLFNVKFELQEDNFYRVEYCKYQYNNEDYNLRFVLVDNEL